MSEFDPLANTQDGNFDNDFEKLDAMNSPQEEIVSSTQNEVQPEPVGDMDPDKNTNEAEFATEPLLDFGQPAAPSVPEPSPSKPAPEKPVESEEPKGILFSQLNTTHDIYPCVLVFWML